MDSERNSPEDVPGANPLVANHDAFYQLCFHWRDSTFDSTDMVSLTAIAAKCPLLKGAAIYQALGCLCSTSLSHLLCHHCIENNRHLKEKGCRVWIYTK